MHSIIKKTFKFFSIVSFLAALTAIIGVWIIWFSDKPDLPYVKYLILLTLGNIVPVVVLLAKHGLKYLPDVETNKDEDETLKFMEDFISSGSSATIVSNRVSWLMKDNNLVDILRKKVSEQGLKIEIITPDAVDNSIKRDLPGVTFIETGEDYAPYSRFTLVNADRSGAEKLAIARGAHPDHEITIFDNNSGPQMIGMAQDIIRKSKELHNAR